MSFADNPIVSFSRGGQDLFLGRFPADSVIHLHGSKGLGLAPVEIDSVERLADHGSRVRAVRYGSREVFIPLYMGAPTQGELDAMRAEMYALFAPHRGPVTITIENPSSGTTRCIEGYLKGGLGGDFGDDYHGAWQTIGLTFECPSPWWLGAEAGTVLRVNPGVKPFISNVSPFFPVVLAQSAVAGDFTVDVGGEMDVYPTWTIQGPGTDPLIQWGSKYIQITGTLAPGRSIVIDTAEGRITPSSTWEKMTLSSELFSLPPGRHRLKVTMAGATDETTVAMAYREKYPEAI